MKLRAVMFAAALAACAAREVPEETTVNEAYAPVVREGAEGRLATRAEQRDPVGVIISPRAEVVPAPFAGRVLRVWVKSGQVVKAGDRIATFDHADLDTQIQETIAEENASRLAAGASYAAAASLRTDYEVTVKLVEAKVRPPIAIGQTRSAWQAKSAEGAAEDARGGKARARRASLERQRAKAELVATLDGTVMQLGIKDGEVVAAGTPVARVFNPENLFVRFAVPPEQRSGLKRGQRVEFRVEGSPRPVIATIERFTNEPPPINFTVVEAAIDEINRFDPDVVRVAATGSVRLAAPHGGQP